MFKHRPFVNFVKYFLPRWRRTREPRRNAVYFSKQHFYFSSTRKRKGCRVMKDEKKGGERGGERSLHSSCRCVLACCWHKEKRGEWKEKRKYILPWLCAHFMYIHIYTHGYPINFHSLLSPLPSHSISQSRVDNRWELFLGNSTPRSIKDRRRSNSLHRGKQVYLGARLP